LELENVFKITSKDKLDINLTYEHTDFNNFTLPGSSVAPACPDGFLQPDAQGICVLSGNKLPRAPTFTLSGGYQHVWTFANGGALTASGRVYYSSSYFLFPINTSLQEQRSYSRTDIFVNYDSPGGRYYVQVFARNLEDNNVAVEGSQTNNINFASLAPPRTFGVTFGARFGD
jgi:iron complex outermembrane receptor protein